MGSHVQVNLDFKEENSNIGEIAGLDEREETYIFKFVPLHIDTKNIIFLSTFISVQ